MVVCILKGVLIYSYICPKCRLLRRIIGALDIKQRIGYLNWQRARVGILIHYFGSRDDVPYNYMFLKTDGSLHEGAAAIPFIIGALLGR